MSLFGLSRNSLKEHIYPSFRAQTDKWQRETQCAHKDHLLLSRVPFLHDFAVRGLNIDTAQEVSGIGLILQGRYFIIWKYSPTSIKRPPLGLQKVAA